MDSKGVAIPARALKTTDRSGTTLVMRNPNRSVSTVLGLTELNQRLEPLASARNMSPGRHRDRAPSTAPTPAASPQSDDGVVRCLPRCR